MRLTVDKFLDHAAKWFGDREIVEADAGRVVARTTTQTCASAAIASPARLRPLGLNPGDRVGTLAWNTRHHLELYYAAMGIGLVCHTLNPRLTVAHLAAMINEAEDRVLAVRPILLPLAARAGRRCARRSSMSSCSTSGSEPAPRCRSRRESGPIETLLDSAWARAAWGEFDERCARRPLLHLGHDRAAQGRALHPSLQLSAHAARAAGRCDRADRTRRRAARGADVSRQWLGPAVRGAGGRAPSWSLPGRHDRRREPRAADARGGRDGRGRRADGVARRRSIISTRTGGELPDLERVIIGGSTCPDALIRRHGGAARRRRCRRAGA